jgi:RNA polymerase sigma-70 factor (ECF subfamily)
MLRDQPNRLLRRALSLGLTRFDAEDAAQSTALTALRKIETVSRADESTICSWIDTIARRTVIDFYRKQSRDRELVNSIELREPDSDPVALALEHEELLSAVTRSIQALPPLTQKIVELRFINELPTQQIADELGVSHAVVRKRLSRTRAALAGAFVDAEKSAQSGRAS